MSELNFLHSNGNKVKLSTPDTLAANKTFKLPGADGSAGQFLQTDGSGALSFASVPTAPIQGYGLFHVRANQNDSDTPQTVANVTQSKIQFKYELADLDGLFDNSTNYRYTPQVAGWYWVNLNISINNGGGHSHLMTAYLYKNGSQYATFEGGGGGGAHPDYKRYGDNNSINMSSIIQLNGSSDYVEGYVYQTNAQSASRNLDNLSTTMMGYLVRRT